MKGITIQLTNIFRCYLDILTVTDLLTPPDDKVQIYISGALHGNERLGPHVSYYLIEFLVNNYGIDSYITNLLKTREILITPMTHAVGFYYNEREERMGGSASMYTKSIDINRDFPYN